LLICVATFGMESSGIILFVVSLEIKRVSRDVIAVSCLRMVVSWAKTIPFIKSETERKKIRLLCICKLVNAHIHLIQ
jgi:hypothetical protein